MQKVSHCCVKHNTVILGKATAAGHVCSELTLGAPKGDFSCCGAGAVCVGCVSLCCCGTSAFSTVTGMPRSFRCALVFVASLWVAAESQQCSLLFTMLYLCASDQSYHVGFRRAAKVRYRSATVRQTPAKTYSSQPMIKRIRMLTTKNKQTNAECQACAKPLDVSC